MKESQRITVFFFFFFHQLFVIFEAIDILRSHLIAKDKRKSLYIGLANRSGGINFSIFPLCPLN